MKSKLSFSCLILLFLLCIGSFSVIAQNTPGGCIPGHPYLGCPDEKETGSRPPTSSPAPTTPTPAPTQLGGDTPFPTFQPTAAPTLSPQPTTTPQPMTTAQPTTAAENPTSGLPPTRNQPSPNGGTAGIRSVEQEGDSGLNGGAIAAIAAGGALLVLGGVLFAKRGGEEPV